MFCPKCGQPVGDGAQFCANCGNPLNGTKPSNSFLDKVKQFFAEMQARADNLKGPEPVDFVKAIKLQFLYALNFKGRSSRSEYWWSYLFNFLLGLALNFVPLIGGLLSVAMIIPVVALAIRRMHDIGKSGWYLLMGLIPLAGPIIALVYLCTASQAEANQWGPSAQYINL